MFIFLIKFSCFSRAPYNCRSWICHTNWKDKFKFREKSTTKEFGLSISRIFAIQIMVHASSLLNENYLFMFKKYGCTKCIKDLYNICTWSAHYWYTLYGYYKDRCLMLNINVHQSSKAKCILFECLPRVGIYFLIKMITF